MLVLQTAKEKRKKRSGIYQISLINQIMGKNFIDKRYSFDIFNIFGFYNYFKLYFSYRLKFEAVFKLGIDVDENI
ncbi:hypothetical protein BpHYR1_053680 [Brachionus plicatilis]|uniref:Uncharacterized protein n=1 Tax=Brachionus plicatilis TaxID=10195 RepID=A0A3M7Q7T2_BRAPC|nr:hypothetical protein BpHYR1_053680 [Brachionus plicatilis]